MKRKQFTFYRSFYEALECLPKTRQLEFLKAILDFAFEQIEPKFSEPRVEALFLLVRPVLESSRKRAEAGKVGGDINGERSKQGSKRGSKQGSKRGSKGEIEMEIETELETETEDTVRGFQEFWDLYPKKIGLQEARKAWLETVEDPEAVLASLRDWCQCPGWNREGGRFVPFPEKWLRQGYFCQKPEGLVHRGATGHLGEAEIEAIHKLLEED